MDADLPCEERAVRAEREHIGVRDELSVVELYAGDAIAFAREAGDSLSMHELDSALGGETGEVLGELVRVARFIGGGHAAAHQEMPRAFQGRLDSDALFGGQHLDIAAAARELI